MIDRVGLKEALHAPQARLGSEPRTVQLPRPDTHQGSALQMRKDSLCVSCDPQRPFIHREKWAVPAHFSRWVKKQVGANLASFPSMLLFPQRSVLGSLGGQRVTGEPCPTRGGTTSSAGAGPLELQGKRLSWVHPPFPGDSATPATSEAFKMKVKAMSCSRD